MGLGSPHALCFFQHVVMVFLRKGKGAHAQTDEGRSPACQLLCGKWLQKRKRQVSSLCGSKGNLSGSCSSTSSTSGHPRVVRLPSFSTLLPRKTCAIIKPVPKPGSSSDCSGHGYAVRLSRYLRLDGLCRKSREVSVSYRETSVNILGRSGLKELCADVF